MNKKYDCGIILDLLPLSLENMVSQETEAVIKNHLSECESCKKVYEEMSLEIDILVEKRKPPKKHKGKKSRVRILIYAYLLLLLSIVAFCLIDMCFL